MAKPITTTSATGVIKSFNEVGIVLGGPPKKYAIVTPDDGSKDVGIEIGENFDPFSGTAYFSVGDKVSYTITDGPMGAIPAALSKAS